MSSAKIFELLLERIFVGIIGNIFLTIYHQWIKGRFGDVWIYRGYILMMKYDPKDLPWSCSSTKNVLISFIELDIGLVACCWAVACKRITPRRIILAPFDFWKLLQFVDVIKTKILRYFLTRYKFYYITDIVYDTFYMHDHLPGFSNFGFYKVQSYRSVTFNLNSSLTK